MALSNKSIDRLLVSRFRKGDPWLHEHANAIVDELRRARIVTDGAAVDGKGGTRLMPTARGADRWFARAPAGGIAARSGNAPGSAVCAFYDWDGVSLTLGARAETVYNPYATTPGVGANKDMWVVWKWGVWWVETEACG